MRAANLITARTNYSIIVKVLLTAVLIIAGSSHCAVIHSKLHILSVSPCALPIHFCAMLPNNSQRRLIGVFQPHWPPRMK